jgi:signal transduction histidine kinase/response regulator of citrate/malate metabolism
MSDEILIIDKDVSHAKALSVYLERKRMESHTASTSEEALVFFDNIGAQVVLADPGLPDLEMISILKRIKSTHPQVQIIIMATPDQFDLAMAELKKSAVHYLIKPVKSTALDMALYQARSWILLKNRVAETENKLKKLRSTQSLYQQLFDEVPCYISVQDSEFRLTATNKLFKRDFGDEIGSHCYSVYKHRGTPCQACPVADTFADGRSHTTEEVVTSKSGKQYNVLTWTAPIRNGDGEITQVMEMSTNITEIRQLQDHLTSLGLMIGSMSHGVKGMLTALDGGIYQLETGLAKHDMERTHKAFDQVKQMTGRIRKMVLEILYYAKSRELRYESINIVEMADKVVSDAMAIASKNGVKLEAKISPTLGIIDVDPTWMQAAMVNFVENAIDACTYDRSKKDHVVTFDAFELSPDKICFIITDNGMGMDQETKEKMFTLFFTSKGSQGTGLGLFIANRVIRQHGGTISVESELKKGSKFHICLPKSKPTQPEMVHIPGESETHVNNETDDQK